MSSYRFEFFPLNISNYASPILSFNLEDDRENQNGDEHHNKGVDEPSHPMHRVTEPHNLHYFLQAVLLLVDNALTDHGDRQDPGQHQEQRQGAGYSVNKPKGEDK